MSLLLKDGGGGGGSGTYPTVIKPLRVLMSTNSIVTILNDTSGAGIIDDLSIVKSYTSTALNPRGVEVRITADGVVILDALVSPGFILEGNGGSILKGYEYSNSMKIEIKNYYASYGANYRWSVHIMRRKP